MVIGAQNVDAFQLTKIDTRAFASNPRHKCVFKGCDRTGRVLLFWRERDQDNQQKDRICVNHALDLANEILSEYKFRE